MPITARDPYAPRYIAYINGVPIPSEISQMIKDVNVEDDAEMFDKVTLDINALQYTSGKNVIDLLDSKLFNPPQVLRIDMGYGNVVVPVAAGEIVKVIPDFGTDSVSMQVTAYDPFFRLSKTKHQTARTFNSKLSEIFSSVIGAYPQGIFVNEIPPGRDIIKKVTQKLGTNDYRFLKELADSKGLDFFNEYDAKTNKFKMAVSAPNDTAEASFRFVYFEHDDEPTKTLYSFQPEMNAVDQITDVQFSNFNPNIKRKIQTYVRTDSTETAGAQDVKFKGAEKTKDLKAASGAVVTFKAFGQHFEIIVGKRFKSEKEAQIYAECYMKGRLDNFITGEAEVIGVETMKARTIVEFAGLSKAYNGNYYVNRVEHDMKDGQAYVCKLHVRKIVTTVG